MLKIGHSLHASDPNVRRAMESGDRDWIAALARRQILAGVDLIDLNASAFEDHEEEILLWCVELLEPLLDRSLMIDSAIPRVLVDVGSRCVKAPWLNSFELSAAWPSELAPLLARGARWIVQLRDGSRIPEDADDRLELCERALERSAANSLPTPWIDAVALPWGEDLEAGRGLLDFLEQARRRWPELRTLVGLSNISYGYRDRARLHRLWLHELRRRDLGGALLDAFDPALLQLAG